MYSKSIMFANSNLGQFSDVALNSQEMQCIEGGGKLSTAIDKVVEVVKEVGEVVSNVVTKLLSVDVKVTDVDRDPQTGVATDSTVVEVRVGVPAETK